MDGSLLWRVYVPLFVRSIILSTTCSGITEVAYGKLLVAVDHNQLQTMASKSVDPIDWSLPPPFTEQYPLSTTYTCKYALQIKSCSKRDAIPRH